MDLYWECAGAKLYQGDCREVMPELAAESVDSIVTDPPYHLTAGKKGGSGEASRSGPENPYGKSYAPTGFMGKSWDGGDVAFQPETWAKAMRLLKPGGYLLAFGGTRTYHRLVCAIEDAGFEIRDSIAWVYGSGFPKSLDVAMAIDKAARGVPQGGSDATSPNHGNYKGGCSEENPTGQGFGAGPGRFMKDGRSKYDGAIRKPAPSTSNGFGYDAKGDISQPQILTEDAKKWSGWGTALKPAMELIVVARKPLSEGTVANNVLKYGTGAMNISGCRIPTSDALGGGAEKETRPDQKGNDGWTRPWMEDGDAREAHAMRVRANVLEAEELGRWPANLIHDGSQEAIQFFPETGLSSGGRTANISKTSTIYGGGKGLGQDIDADSVKGDPGYGDYGTAARYFYCAKASREDRNEGLDDPGPQFEHDATLRKIEDTETSGNHHPTVKPLDLMKYLCRLVTPPNGTVLDPFSGSGSTGKAALYEGFNFIGIEGEKEYCAISKARMEFVLETDSPLFRAVLA